MKRLKNCSQAVERKERSDQSMMTWFVWLYSVAGESGGRIFKRNWDLKGILAEARKP